TVDLYLIHWAAPGLGLYRDTWKALVRLHEEGRVRAIGVSNHHEEHLNNIIADTGVTPALNQVETHPYLQQNDLRAVHEKLEQRPRRRRRAARSQPVGEATVPAAEGPAGRA